MFKRSKAILLNALILLWGASFSQGAVFSLSPTSGEITVIPGEVDGFGYSILNDSQYYFLPISLSHSGVLVGTMEDIFYYPVLAPDEYWALDYFYVAPGGFGNSLGLFEYTAPADIALGLVQTGTVTLIYQLYDANPDLVPGAQPVGDQVLLTDDFTITAVSPDAEIPEPGTASLVLLFSGVVLAVRSASRFLQR